MGIIRGGRGTYASAARQASGAGTVLPLLLVDVADDILDVLVCIFLGEEGVVLFFLLDLFILLLQRDDLDRLLRLDLGIDLGRHRLGGGAGARRRGRDFKTGATLRA